MFSVTIKLKGKFGKKSVCKTSRLWLKKKKKTMRDYKGLSRALESRKKERAGKTIRIRFQTMSRVHTKEKL